MASLQQKRPSISNWFSSLRRQPKNKKNTGLHSVEDKKQFQRSCIDLRTSSTFYVGPPAVAEMKKLSSMVPTPHHTRERSNTTAGDKIMTSTGASMDILHDANEDDDDRRGLVTGKHMSQLCSRCCCNLSSQSRSNSPSAGSPSSPCSTPLAPFTSGPTALDATTPTTPPPFITPPPTFSAKTVTETDTSRNVKIIREPCDEPNTIILNKRSEFKRTTSITTTRTITISRPVELILNERGEIVSRRPHPKTTRSNSLGCVLDDDHSDNEDEDGGSVAPTFATAVGEGGEFRFIDDSSTSQSENERNSQNSNNKQHLRDKVVSSHRSTNNNNNNNKNQQDLCDVCQNVILRNRTNTAQSAVIMRNKQIKDELCEVVSEMEALDVPEDCKHSNKDKQMSIGRKKFNMDPKKGIEYLVENRLLRHDPQDVAHFLYKGEGLNKTAIGDYLGEKNDFNEDVLKAFVALHDFTNLILVQALRQFLWSFRLPGEAQKIDRMMECFAQRYCQLNPDIFTNTDTCYVLSFAIIMLNTSLHNPSVKDKPPVEQFISMNRGINNGGDLPRGLLESLYESIRTEPFKIPQDDGNDLMHTFFNPDKEGWLWKQGGRYKSWKRRWFILNDNCLYYFEYTTDKEPRGIIPLENISVREIPHGSKPHCFELFATGGADIIKACKTDSEGKVVEGKHTVYRMSAATEEDQQEWIKRLTQSISHNPFYDILVQRKKKALSKS